MALASAADLIAQVDRAWGPFAEAVERLGEHGIEGETLAEWSGKEMLGHVAFWDEAVVGAVTGMIRGQEMPEGWGFKSGYVPSGDWPRADVHNAREAAWARGQTAAAVLERLWKSHREMREFLGSVTPEELKERPDYFNGIGKHYIEHQADLEELI